MIKNYQVTVNGKTYQVQVEEQEAFLSPVALEKVDVPEKKAVVMKTTENAVVVEKTQTAKAEDKPIVSTDKTVQSKGKGFTAPMSGLILEVYVKPGQKVKFGDALLKIEAMKMENDIVCDMNGVVEEVYTQKGETVETGKILVSVVKL